MTLSDPGHDDTRAWVWVEGGEAGETVRLTNRIVTVSGAQIDQPIKILIAPTVVEPVTIDEIKAYHEIDFDEHDWIIEKLIRTAREYCERRTSRCFVRTTKTLKVAAFEDEIALPTRPVISISQVAYINEDGDLTTVDSDDYDLVIEDTGAASVIPLVDWPTDVFVRKDAVRIEFVAGYENDNVPEDVRQAIRELVGAKYELREAVTLAPVRQELMPTPLSIDTLLAPFIVPRL